MSKPTEQERRKALEKWSTTPSPNPRYKGATPADVARALLGKKPLKKADEDPSSTPGRAR